MRRRSKRRRLSFAEAVELVFYISDLGTPYFVLLSLEVGGKSMLSAIVAVAPLCFREFAQNAVLSSAENC
jgi:hypothetical protein